MNTTPSIRDIQEMLPHRGWQIGTRTGLPRYLTLHYNGPAVTDRTPKGEMAQLIADAHYHMKPGSLGSATGGDGLQYHYAVGSNGVIYQCRDDTALLWHSGHEVGNAQSLAIHIPIGATQEPTTEQWASAVQLCEWLRAHYGIPIERVLCHNEWKKTTCPGPTLTPRLIRWRQNAPATAIRRWGATNRASAVYEAPRIDAPIAMGGQAHLAKGQAVECDAILVGSLAHGDVRWLHRKDGLGFIPFGAMDITLV